MERSIAVVTLTRERQGLLKRAIASVQQQDYTGQIVHLVIVDDCQKTKEFLERADDLPNRLEWHWFPRTIEERSGSPRIAKLRNFAVQIAETNWIAFLDDDNEFEHNHLSSLVACAVQSGCRAVHSHMQIFYQDGTPYLEARLPWSRNPEQGKQMYAQLCKKGVFKPGSNIVRDRADPWNHPAPTRTVDMGEWLFERTLLLEYPFCTEYSHEEWLKVTTEDDKLMEKLIENKVPISCSELPTLKYYLGGYSNVYA